MIGWAVGIGIATVFTTAILAIPALITARYIATRRALPPLRRGALERNLVMFASLVGAAGALAWSDGWAIASRIVGGWGASDTGTVLMAFVAPVPLAAVPWVAGEMFSGPSLRPFASFTASAAVACASSWTCYAVLWAGKPAERLDASIVLVQVPVVLTAALLAARTYLAARGDAIHALPPEAVALDRAASDYSSSISENLSLRGASSGFF